jgi:ATP-dependent Clp protease ATP-binding subunit ClpA
MRRESQEFVEPFNNFTPRAQQILALARREADRFHHAFLGTEHLLLGLIVLGQGTGLAVLRNMGVSLDTLRMEVEKQIGRGPDRKAVGNVPYTPRVKKVLRLAAQEAKSLHHTYVGTEHILLGLLREDDGVAARVLKGPGLNLEEVRQNILKELDPNFASSTRSETLQKPHIGNREREPVDLSRRYDLYCREGDRQVVYPNVLFKGVRTLFQHKGSDVWGEYLELEQADGQRTFVPRVWVLKFCEHGKTPGAETVAGDG